MGHELTVMVVDDNPTLRELIAVQLLARGYDVVEAEDGREAVELAKEKCPALIIMDLQMPVMDGFDAARMIRSVGELCRTPIIAFSAYGDADENRRAAVEAGCTEFVSKTVGITLVHSLVERYLRAAQLH